MNIAVESQTTAKLKRTLIISKVTTGQSISLTPFSPVVIPAANQFPSGQQKYFKMFIEVDFQEISEAEYNAIPAGAIIT